MLIRRAYKTELDPNAAQRQRLLQHAGTNRWVYNWALRASNDAYAAVGSRPSAFDLMSALVRLKREPYEEGGVPWLGDVASAVVEYAVEASDRALKRFLAGTSGRPRFKSRRRGVGSFRTRGAIRVTEGKIRLPRLGWVRLKECGYLPADGQPGIRIISATVSERAGRWFVSLAVEQRVLRPAPSGPVLGVDVGINALATLSDGTSFDNPRALRRAEGRLRRLQRQVSRKVKGSKNRRKAIQRLARQHYRVACIRKDALHKATTAIAKRASVLGVESLHVRGLVRNRALSKALSDASLGEFLRQLDYKALWRGVTVIKADRFYPSSKRCSSCGVVKVGLALRERTFRCGACGLALDRDVNAARNLQEMAASSAATACGEDVRPSGGESDRNAASVKQEPGSGPGERPDGGGDAS